MRSSYLINLTLLAVIIGLLWLQYGKDEAQPVATVSTMQADAVTHIAIERHGQPVVTLARDSEGWQLTDPFPARASATRIQLLLDLLSMPVQGHFSPAADVSLEPFGLAEPAMVVLMNDAYFAFGEQESLSRQRYLLHGDTIYLIDDTLTPLLRSGAASFVDNRLIADKQRIYRLRLPQVDAGEPDFGRQTLIEFSDEKWQSDQQDLSSDTIAGLVESWRHAYAMQVRRPSADLHNAETAPLIEVWLEQQDHPLRLQLQLGEQDMQLIDIDTHLHYTFPRALLNQLLPPKVR